MRVLLVAVLLLGVALAGCSSSKNLNEVYTCKGSGHKVDLSTVTGSGAKDFNKESACPALVKPHVDFTPPAGAVAYHPVKFTWTVSAGNYTGGHTMLTSIRMSHHPIGLANLTKPDDYGIELAKVAHQDLPAIGAGSYNGFTAPATVYLRAYATIRSNELPDADYWSPEYAFTIAPVAPTGNVTLVTHPAGPAVGGQGGTLDKTTVKLALGDAISFKNLDAIPHTFTFATGPVKLDAVTVAADGTSPNLVLTVPGTYSVHTDDKPTEQTLTLNVELPA